MNFNHFQLTKIFNAPGEKAALCTKRPEDNIFYAHGDTLQ